MNNDIDRPDFIYHYTKTIYFALILPLMRLKMSKIEDANDPREKIKHYEGVFKSGFFNPQDERVELIENFLNNYSTITCFSGSSDLRKGFDLPTMWAHYADNHKGLCLEINTQNFILENNSSYFFDKMNYALSAEYNKFSIHEDTTSKEIINKLVFLKRNDWSSEQEWRLFSMEGANFCSIKNSLKSIILGLDFNSDYLPLIKLLKKPEIKLKKIVIDECTQKFGLIEIS